MIDVAAYAPAGAILLVIGGTAALVSQDPVLIVLAVLLALLTFGIGVALYRAGYVAERQVT